MNFAQTRKRSVGRARRSMRGGVVLGIFVGLILGLAIAAAVAFYLGRSGYSVPVPGAARDAGRGNKTDMPPVASAPDKPRFDFYKILPGGEEPKIQADKTAPPRPDRVLGEKAAEKSAEAKAGKTAEPAPAAVKAVDKPVDKVASNEPLKGAHAADRFWLQAGSFTDQADAENLKAQLALGGWQAAVQQGVLADKSVRYRVRLGPYDNSDELSRVKNQLAQRGYESAAIRY